MSIDQKEVYVTPDELGRAAIVACADGFLRIYTHWRWSAESQEAFKVAPGGPTNWLDDRTPVEDLYADVEPQPGLYQVVEDARKAVLSLPGFSEATLVNENVAGGASDCPR